MINKIIIKNFKSIQSAELELKPLNILIGANGSGKSNFISFFEFLNNIYEQNLQHYIIENGSAEKFLYYGSKESDSLFAQIFFDNTNYYKFNLLPDKTNSLFFQYEINGFNKNFQEVGINLDWNEEVMQNVLRESRLKFGKSVGREYLRENFNSFKVFHFHDTSSSAKVKKICNINDNMYLREDASNLAAFLYLLQEKFPVDFKIIEKTIKSVAPFFKEFDLKPLALNQDTINLKWKEEGSNMYFNANNISDGTLRFICLSTLLLQPNLPKIIIIDEPELGLHPFAINKLAGLLKSASDKSQVIVSTQSVNLLENFDVEDIIVVDRENKQSTFNRLSSDNLKEWLEDYTLGELWDKNLIGGRQS